MMERTGNVFNIQRFSIQDGPGIRSTVFMKGCPLRCLWCSNPESQNTFAEVAHRNLLCNKCGRCVDVCELQAISLTGNGVKINRKTCTGCGKCIEVCIPGALKFYGEERSVEEVYQEVVRDKPFYQNSGGGMTASGGEPLFQADFIVELFKRCQDAGIHTCLDTCGYANPGVWEKVLPYTNLVLFDVKLIDTLAHRRVIGKSSEKILRSLKLVAVAGVPVIVRIPVIPGINDSEGNIKDIARYVAGLNTLREVNLLPYHRFGEGKYAMLDRRYNLGELTPLKESQLEELRRIFKSFDLDCEVVI